MPNKEELSEFAQHLSALPRPHLTNRHSNSVPSTPYQHTRRLSFGARSPSPEKRLRNGSPKSTHSQLENGTRTRAKAPSFAGCQYETGMAFSRRRIPYSIGGDQLERAKTMPKKFLNHAEEGKLSGDMRELYDRILPSKESDRRRADFVQKLDTILNQRWPGNEIKVYVFGSSGNMLCTNDSDVDICITTPLKALEKTCLLAAALAERGMERVVCVPHAKVPIVKFWDPELQLACDMNVNNTLALENTRMIKTYVDIDERVRPLAMIVKHWTKRRILNDAALGGTLSSYAWICMILNFLQTRNPPIIPSLHEKSNKTIILAEGKYAAFNDDLESLRGFGKQNKETLGDLVFQFFRRYAHDIDYEKNVVSVREGRLISKEAKKWHLMQNNRLCVEEPFNIERNLGNTADDISFRGIHLELRRAFELISEAKLSECLEQYTFPATEEKVWERPTPKAPPVLTRSRSQSQSSRGKAGYAGRGGRHHASNHHSKSRRASSAAATNKYPLPPSGPHAFSDRSAPSQEHLIQAQFEQLKLHRHLFDEMQTLQRQEYELRLKQAQVQLQQEIEVQASNSGPPSAPHSAREQSRRLQMPAQVAPLTAPLRGGQHFPPFMYPQVPGTPYQNVQTQPSSPSLRHAQPDLRRSIHRTSTNDGNSSTNVRSHSQPARSMPVNVALQNPPPLPMNGQQLLQYQSLRHQQQMPQDHLYYDLQGHGMYSYADLPGYMDPGRRSVQQTFDESIPKEYAGYWINDSPPYIHRDDNRMPRVHHSQDLYPRVRGVPPNFGRLQDSSRSPSPSPALPLRDRSFSLQSASSGPVGRSRHERVQGTAPPTRGPIIINGTDTSHVAEGPQLLESSSHTTTVSEATSGSDDAIYETPATAEMEMYCNGAFEDSFATDQAQHLYQGQPMPDGLRHTHFDPRSYMEPSPRRLANQPVENGALQPSSKHSERKQGTSRGLNIQFGEVEYTRPPAKGESSAPRDSSRSTKHASRIDPPAIPSSNGQSDKPQIPLPLLSPVREVRTPSPTGRRKEEIAGLSKASSTKRTIGKMDLYIPPFSELVQARQEKEMLQKGREKTKSPRSNGTLTPTPDGTGPSRATPQASPSHVPQAPQNTPSSISPRPGASHPQVNGWQQQASKKNKKSRSRPGSGNYPGEPLPINEAERKGG